MQSDVLSEVRRGYRQRVVAQERNAVLLAPQTTLEDHMHLILSLDRVRILLTWSFKVSRSIKGTGSLSKNTNNPKNLALITTARLSRRAIKCSGTSNV